MSNEANSSFVNDVPTIDLGIKVPPFYDAASSLWLSMTVFIQIIFEEGFADSGLGSEPSTV